jgi:ATP-dependent Zn protease
LSISENNDFTLNPGSIGTYLITLELVDDHMGVLIVNDGNKVEKEPDSDHKEPVGEDKEKTDHKEPADVEENEDDLEKVIQDQHKIPVIDINNPMEISKTIQSEHDKWNHLFVGFLIIFIPISCCLYFMFCRKKGNPKESTLLPVTKNEDKDQ